MQSTLATKILTRHQFIKNARHPVEGSGRSQSRRPFFDAGAGSVYFFRLNVMELELAPLADDPSAALQGRPKK